MSVQIEELVGTAQQPQPQANHITEELHKNPKSPVGAVKQRKTQDDEADTASTETSSDDEPSVIRNNLLGPLTFDDLYYAWLVWRDLRPLRLRIELFYRVEGGYENKLLLFMFEGLIKMYFVDFSRSCF